MFCKNADKQQCVNINIKKYEKQMKSSTSVVGGIGTKHGNVVANVL